MKISPKHFALAIIYAFRRGAATKRKRGGISFKILERPPERKPTMLEIELHPGQAKLIGVTPIDDSQNPAPVQDGSLQFIKLPGHTTDCNLVVDGNKVDIQVYKGTPPGEITIQVDADADLGEGFTEVLDYIKLTVKVPLATGFKYDVGATRDL